MKTPREVAEDVLAQEPWATALWDREAAIALVVEAVEQSRREVAALTEKPTEFKVGDRVRLTGDSWFGTGYEGEVVSIHKMIPAVGTVPETPSFVIEGVDLEIYRDEYDDFSATKVED